ncbi:hypothetical protein A2716_02615 [candidate division WWE3 bacterium RIFCSPHIGHO2_01_FULL_40_23]|uniref:Uncharacterized protein n=1 Tax=candidate division WWE3 bacterium RIFCSPLOWO2_01_FULL_41_18 TaxID=1802625 RepID=A0A1F4VG13_UNCKA|nr:MAG: hypothetical protein A2716_02615 [candidate division WWE3 bacterium RIFCSPHIGHO2_01_FULL_40_23]OGC55878.1 MAG: hypothetical protein A3A78_02465 [candidate division WWE3 bacterium RIFCSPLOWO2_01_FULL_41_18]
MFYLLILLVIDSTALLLLTLLSRDNPELQRYARVSVIILVSLIALFIALYLKNALFPWNAVIYDDFNL